MLTSLVADELNEHWYKNYQCTLFYLSPKDFPSMSWQLKMTPELLLLQHLSRSKLLDWMCSRFLCIIYTVLFRICAFYSWYIAWKKGDHERALTFHQYISLYSEYSQFGTFLTSDRLVVKSWRGDHLVGIHYCQKNATCVVSVRTDFLALILLNHCCKEYS